MNKPIMLILLAIPFAAGASMLEGIIPSADEEEEEQAVTTVEQTYPSEVGAAVHVTHSANAKKFDCELSFKKPEYLGGPENARIIRFDVKAKGKNVYSGSRETTEKEIYSTVETIARKQLPNESSLGQKEVIQKYLENNCKIDHADPGTTDHAFELLACLSKVYEKKLHEDVRKDVSKKLAMCK